MLVGTLAAGVVFIHNGVREGKTVLIDFALLRNRAYGTAVLSNFSLNEAVDTMVVANIWLQQGYYLVPPESGMMASGYLVTILTIVRVGKKPLWRYGARLPMMIGPALTIVAIGLISYTFPDKALYIGVAFANNVLFGPRLGCYATPPADATMANASENKVGATPRTYKAGSSLGGVTGIAVMVSLSTLFSSLDMTRATQYALWFNATLYLGAMVVNTLLLPRASHS